jgi:malonyl-CoA O-methyltransferase
MCERYALSSFFPFQQEVIIRDFNQAAAYYDQVSQIPSEIADRLFDRLAWMKVKPETILDLGSATGFSTQRLSQIFPNADVIALDISLPMLHKAKEKTEGKASYLCADAAALPIADYSVDLIFSNCLFQFLPFSDALFNEFHRVLRPEALLLFSTCGPDTLMELRASWDAVDTTLHVHPFLDMHHIGDALQRNHFLDPVMEMDRLTVAYDDLYDLFRDLQQLGVSNKHKDRRRGLTGKDRFKNMMMQYQNFFHKDEQWPLTIEMIIGHAWANPGVNDQDTELANEVRIPLSTIQHLNKKPFNEK